MANTITLKVSKNVTAEHLTTALAQIGKHTGCLPCGLLGYEVVFLGDPDPGLEKNVGELRGLPGIEVQSFA